MRTTILAGLFATAIVAASCGGDDDAPDPVDPVVEAATVGTYALVAVNGNPLPFKYGQSDTSRFDWVSGTIILQANHDMSDDLTSTETRLSNGAPIGVEAVQRFRGTWSIRGDSVRLVYPGLGVQMAGRTATTLVLAVGAVSFSYAK